MDRIVSMLELQQELNDSTNGLDWEDGLTKDGKIIDWKRCIFLEGAELINSYPWKHWKNINSSADYENIKIECVDIWHFVMSEALKEYKIFELGNISTLASDIVSSVEYKMFKEELSIKRDIYAEIKSVENMIATLFTSNNIHTLMGAFFEMSLNLGVNIETLYSLYIGKNILNKFRQDNGYKEGTYIKIWNGLEDNVVMQSILEQDNSISPKQLYFALQSKYPKNL